MNSLEDNFQNRVFARGTSSDISIGDRIEHGHTYDQANAASYLVSPNLNGDSGSIALSEPNLLRPSSSYIVMRSDNLESNVDSWIAGCDNERNQRRDNTTVVQQASLNGAHGTLASIWYMFVLLPAISFQRHIWCSPSNSFAAVLNLLDLLSTYLKQIKQTISNARTKLSQIAVDEILREYFVIAMDFALALHAFIFLLLAVYQNDI